MKILSYLTNPMGKGSSVLMLGESKKLLDSQYDRLYPKMSIIWYKINNSGYIAHIKVPSNSVDNLFYDVLIEFTIESIENGTSIAFGDEPVKVFSNCPSFTFTYAYVFNKNNELIDWCRSKYSKEIIIKEPEKRNPYKIINYEKSLYFAIKFLTTGGRNYRSKIKTQALNITNYSKIYNQIKSSDKILEEYSSKKTEVKSKNDITKKNINDSKSITQYKNKKSLSNKTKKINKTLKTTKSKKINKSSKTHKI